MAGHTISVVINGFDKMGRPKRGTPAQPRRNHKSMEVGARIRATDGEIFGQCLHEMSQRFEVVKDAMEHPVDMLIPRKIFLLLRRNLKGCQGIGESCDLGRSGKCRVRLERRGKQQRG
jgi:hypothetical protein